MRTLFLLIGLMALVFPSAAQRGDPRRAEPREPRVLSIDRVSTAYDAETGLMLNIAATQVDGCDFPLVVTTQPGNVENAVFIDIKRDTAALTNKPCVSEPVPVELQVQLTAETLETVLAQPDFDMLYLVVNDAYFRLPITREGEAPTFGEPESLLRQDVGIDMASIEPGEAEGEFVLVAAGMHPTTCMGPDLVRQSIDGGTLKIEIFKLVPNLNPMKECPQTLLPPTYEGRIPLNLSTETETVELRGSFLVDVNGYQFTYDFDTQTQGEGRIAPFRVDTVIESAEVLVMESFPPQLMLNVKGYQPDGCQFPVIVEQSQEGNTIYVSIYREVPANVRCTMNIVPYEDSINLGSFEPGQYTIDVNGTLVDVQL
jgi:hypothetical protein